MTGTVTVTLDRNSVAMGDDVESHRVFWVFPDSATIDGLLVDTSSRYVPGIGGPARWSVDINTDDQTRRLGLGIIYTHDDLNQESRIR